VRVILKYKLVILNEETSKVLSCYMKALESASGKSEKELSEILLTKEKSDRAGIWAVLLRQIEKVTDEPKGGKEQTLPQMEVDIDPPANVLRKSFMSKLHEVSIENNISDKQIIADKISEKNVLIGHLLIRLVTMALCTDMQADKDGDMLLEALVKFIQKLGEGDLIIQKSMLLNSKLSLFGKFFIADMPKWNRTLKGMVSAIKKLHQNTTAISNCLNYYEELKYSLISRLVVRLDVSSKFGPESYDNELIEDTFKYLEDQRVFASHKPTLSQKTPVQLLTQRTDSDNRHKIISSFKDFHVQEEIKKLYHLLDITIMHQGILSKLDFINTAASWVPIITGVVRFDHFKKIMEEHSKICLTALMFERDDPLLCLPAGIALQRCNNISILECQLISCAADLDLLSNKDLLIQLGSLMVDNIRTLASLQNSIGCQILDTQICEQYFNFNDMPLLLSPQSSSSTSQSNLEFQESLSSQFKSVSKKSAGTLGVMSATQEQRDEKVKKGSPPLETKNASEDKGMTVQWQLKKASIVAKEQMVLETENANDDKLQALQLYHEKKYNEALQKLLELYEKFPKDDEINYALAEILFRSGRAEQAIPFLDNCIQNDAGSDYGKAARLLKVKTLNRLGRYESARDEVDILLPLYRGSPEYQVAFELKQSIIGVLNKRLERSFSCDS